MPNHLLKEVERYAKLLSISPKVGAPLEGTKRKGKNTYETTYQGHIIDSESTGVFLPELFYTLEEALEFSVNIVRELVQNK